MLLSKLLLIFVLVPLVELLILLEVGKLLGTFRTLALIVVTGIVGASLAKAAGVAAIARMQRSLLQGKMPAVELMDGVLILIAGALLITPGLLTDLVGFLLLIPKGRSFARLMLARSARRKLSDLRSRHRPTDRGGEDGIADEEGVGGSPFLIDLSDRADDDERD